MSMLRWSIIALDASACVPWLQVDWYLDRVTDAVDLAKRETDGAPVTLLAHSVRPLLLCPGN